MATTFDGLGNLDGLSPGDPTGAGGLNHVVVAVNASMAVYDRTGVLEAGPLTLASLPSNPLAAHFDPKVVYDQYTDTYLLAFIGWNNAFAPTSSRIYVVAIPDATAATPATWCASSAKGDQGPGKQIADFPGLGYDQNRVYIATNQYETDLSSFFGSQILAFDKAGLEDCVGTPTWTTFDTDATKLADGRKAQSVQPATSIGSAGKEYLIEFDAHCPKGATCTGDRLALFRIKGGSGTPELSSTTIGVPAVEMGQGTQKGAPLSDPDAYWDVGDLRLGNAFFDEGSGRLYAGHAISMDLDPGDGYVEAVARWYEVKPMGKIKKSSLTRRGNVGDPLKDAGWPAVATDSLGNLFMTYSRASGASGAKEFLSAWSTLIAPGKKAAQPPILVGAGTSLYAPQTGPERWGDFNATNRDPVDGTRVWQVNQEAVSINDFQQVVTEVFDL